MEGAVAPTRRGGSSPVRPSIAPRRRLFRGGRPVAAGGREPRRARSPLQRKAGGARGVRSGAHRVRDRHIRRRRRRRRCERGLGLLPRHRVQPHRGHRPARAPWRAGQRPGPRGDRLAVGRSRDVLAACPARVRGHPLSRRRHRRLRLAGRVRVDGPRGHALVDLRAHARGGGCSREHPVLRRAAEGHDHRVHRGHRLDLHLHDLRQPIPARVVARPAVEGGLEGAGRSMGRLSAQPRRPRRVRALDLQRPHRRERDLDCVLAPADAERSRSATSPIRTPTSGARACATSPPTPTSPRGWRRRGTTTTS